jgi:hypothetical protein
LPPADPTRTPARLSSPALIGHFAVVAALPPTQALGLPMAGPSFCGHPPSQRACLESIVLLI